MSAHTELLKVDRARRAIAAESRRVVYRMPRPSIRRWCKTHLTGNQAQLSRRELRKVAGIASCDSGPLRR